MVLLKISKVTTVDYWGKQSGNREKNKLVSDNKPLTKQTKQIQKSLESPFFFFRRHCSIFLKWKQPLWVMPRFRDCEIFCMWCVTSLHVIKLRSEIPLLGSLCIYFCWLDLLLILRPPATYSFAAFYSVFTWLIFWLHFI